MTGLPCWGQQHLVLHFPFVRAGLFGLSDRQHQILSRNYTMFTNGNVSSSVDMEIYAGWQSLMPLAPKQLSLRGQYAPFKIRQGNNLRITGVNFNACLPLFSGAYGQIGVACEDHLTHSNVIENVFRFLAAYRALSQQGIVLHSAGLVFDNQAFIFAGHSGAGKTTLTRKAYRAGARILSDDINLLLPDEGNGYLAHAVPFAGEFGRTLDLHWGEQQSFPVAAIILLEQGEQLALQTAAPAAAIARLVANAPFVNTDAHESAALFDSLTHLVRQTPVFKLINRRDDRIDAIMQCIQDRIKPHD